MIEVKGPDGRIFKFPVGTPASVITETMNANYGDAYGAVGASAPVQAPVHAPPPPPYVPPYQPPVEDDGPAENKAMKLSLIVGGVAVVALLAAGAFWMGGRGGESAGAPAVPATEEAASTDFSAFAQTEVRQALVATQVRQAARADSPIIRELVAGAVVDALGEQSVGGVNWIKVQIDNNSSQTGWVVGDHLSSLGGQITAEGITPQEVAPGALTVPPEGATPPAASPIPQTSYYIASREANVRTGAGTDNPVAVTLRFGAVVVADQQVDVEGRPWIRVRTDDGTIGWISTRLTSLTKPDAPIDARPPAPPPAPAPSQANTADWRGNSQVTLRKRAASGFYVQVGAAQSEFELQDLVNRMSGAERCMGYAPSYYESELFSRSRAGMVISNFGPFPSRADAEEAVSQLRPCIPDTYIIRQP